MDDRIRNGLSAAADRIDTGAPMEELAGVRHSVRRRRRRRTVAAVFGAGALIAGGAVAVVSLDRSDDEAIRSASPPTTTAPPTTVAEAATASEADAPAESVPEEQPGPAESTPADSSTVDGSSGSEPEVVPTDPASTTLPAGSFIGSLVPWQDGFIALSPGRTIQQLPEAFPEEITALFPPEVVELFADGLPATIDEATAMLNEAGLLDEVTEVLSNHPEASDAIYSAPVEQQPPTALFSVDGEEWSPIEVTPPDSPLGVEQLSAAGDRLISSSFGGGPFASTLAVSSTTDLVNWTTQPIAPDLPDDLPEAVVVSGYFTAMAANENGWVVAVEGGLQIQPELIVPDDVVDVMFDRGYGHYTDDAGVVIEIPSGPNGEREEYRYTWEELGVPPEVAAELSVGGTFGSDIWSASWDGTPVRSAVEASSGSSLVGTSAGFLIINGADSMFSPDGLAWSPIDVPFEEGFVMATMPTDTGAVLFVGGPTGGTTVYEVDATGQQWDEIEIPGLPATAVPAFGPSSQSPVIVVDAAVHVQPDIEISIEIDGYRYTDRSNSEGISYEVVDVASGEVVVAESHGRDELTADVPSSGPYEFLAYGSFGTRTITDPASGEVILEFDDQDLAAAYDEAFSQMEESVYEPDQWLIATDGAGRWLVEDLVDESPDFWPTAAAVNGDTVLVLKGESALRFEFDS